MIDSITKKVDATLEYRDDVQIDRQVGKFDFEFCEVLRTNFEQDFGLKLAK